MTITEIVDEKMPSFTEWMEQIGLKNIDEFREEDNSKRDRLEVLFETIGLTYDRPEKMTARDIADKTPLFLDIVKRKGDHKCALRLIPAVTGLPKLRVRGKTLRENLLWFAEQKINPDEYKVEVVPHKNTLFSCIFVLNDEGAWGEIIPGQHWKLTQGIYENTESPMTFSYDFGQWQFSRSNEQMQNFIKTAINKLNINEDKRTILIKKLSAEFTTKGYLQGYFEFVVWENEPVFVDYNRLLHRTIKKIFAHTVTGPLTGVCASPGRAVGRIKIVNSPADNDFSANDILVCQMTMVDHLPLMKKAGAIVTAQGGLLTHAAIVSRELGKPCLVGVKDALTLLETGQTAEVDASKGIVKILP